MMKKQLRKRLQELRSEFESGQKTLADLETKRTSLKETLLRISGAIQVLEEELTKCENNLSDEEKLKIDGAGDSEIINAHGEAALPE